MKTKAEVLIDQLEQAAMRQEELSSETPYNIGDIVNLSESEYEYIGMIEDEDRGVYQIRVQAVAGDEFEPTDKVYFRYAEEITPYEKAPVMETDSEDSDNEGEVERNEKSIQAGDYVEWLCEEGNVHGKVQEIVEGKANIEVYVKESDSYTPTGVFVDIEQEHIEPTVIDVKSAIHKILTKMDNVNMEVDGNIGRFKGIGSQYGQVDLGGDTVAKGAYTQTLNHKGGKIKLLFDHGYKTKDIAGVAMLTDSDQGLMVDAEMPLEAQDVKDSFVKIKFLIERGEPVGLSIGYDPIKVTHNADGTRTLNEIALHEMSITPFPMDTGAKILYAKSKRIQYKAMQTAWQTIPTDAPLGNQGD